MTELADLQLEHDRRLSEFERLQAEGAEPLLVMAAELMVRSVSLLISADESRKLAVEMEREDEQFLTNIEPFLERLRRLAAKQSAVKARSIPRRFADWWDRQVI
jgi:hypothetical protein